MERVIDISINSKKYTPEIWHHLASQTAVHFVNEKVIAEVQAKGSAEFFKEDGTLIAAGNVEPERGGMEKYEDISFYVTAQTIELRFPVYKWIDNYPHCDGEHDRWDSKITGFRTLKLDLVSGTIL